MKEKYKNVDGLQRECYCGSNKNLKDCCYSKRILKTEITQKNINNIFKNHLTQNKKEQTCLFPDCTKKAVGSHSLSQKSQLISISQTNNKNNQEEVIFTKIIAIQNKDNHFSLDFTSHIEKKSVTKASVLPLFCSEHEQIYHNIDAINGITIPTNQKDLFLLNVRTIAAAIKEKQNIINLYQDILNLELYVKIYIEKFKIQKEAHICARKYNIFNGKYKEYIKTINLEGLNEQEIFDAIGPTCIDYVKKDFDQYIKIETKHIEILTERLNDLILKSEQKNQNKTKYILNYITQEKLPFAASGIDIINCEKTKEIYVITFDTIKINNKWVYLIGIPIKNGKTPERIGKFFKIEKTKEIKLLQKLKNMFQPLNWMAKLFKKNQKTICLEQEKNTIKSKEYLGKLLKYIIMFTQNNYLNPTWWENLSEQDKEQFMFLKTYGNLDEFNSSSMKKIKKLFNKININFNLSIEKVEYKEY